MNQKKEVFFDVYCPDCKHKTEPETEKPCDECLGYFVNDNSHKPVLFEQRKKDYDNVDSLRK